MYLLAYYIKTIVVDYLHMLGYCIKLFVSSAIAIHLNKRDYLVK